MNRTKNLLCVLLAVLLIVPFCAAIPFATAATTYTKESSHAYLGGDASYAKYTLKGNNGTTVDAHVLECAADDYLMMVYSGCSSGAALLEDHYNKAVADGYDVVAMVNGSFFSMDTDNYGCYGRLVEYDVVNGELFTGDAGNPADAYDGALCIMSDGSMVSVPNSQLAFHLSFNGVEVKNALGTVNKTGGDKLVTKNGNYLDNWSNLFYYFDSHCGKSVPTYKTLTAEDGTTRDLVGCEIVCEKTNTTGLRIGGTQYGKIKRILKDDAGSEISDNEFVLFLRAGSPYLSVVDGLKEGDEVSIAVEETVSSSAAITEKANSIVENVNYLVKDGVNLTLDAATFNKTAAHSLSVQARWTALGVKKDGTYVLFTTTGGTTGSDGSVLLTDVAYMMKEELGCETVVRMDGGGSTAMYLQDDGSGKAGYKQNQGRRVADVIMIVKKSTSKALTGAETKETLESLVAEYDGHTEAAFASALAEAKAVLASQSAVSGDYGRVQMNLEEVASSYSKLDAAIASAAEAYKGDYTPTNWKALQEALVLAKNAKVDPNATVKSVSEAVRSLVNAVASTGSCDILISQGKPYVSTPAANKSWPDTNGKELTDGDLGNAGEASGSAWSGFNANDSRTPEVVVDLGAVTDGLSLFNARFLNMSSWGIQVPTSMTVSVSDDGVSYTEVGTYTPSLSSGELGVDGVAHDFTVSLEEPVSGRYVKFGINLRSSWAFISEVQISKNEITYVNIPHPVYGDADGDGEIGASDSTMLVQYLAGIDSLSENTTEEQMDLDSNGKVDVYDCVLMLRYQAGLITEFPSASAYTVNAQ